jgi:hypothetical protein
MAMLVLGGCADGGTVLDPASPGLSVQGQASTLVASPAQKVTTTGTFDAIVDFSTLTPTPRGRNCELTVQGQLVFSGTIVGPATGQTTALVFASCADMLANPPGTFPDVFHSELVFDGTVDGAPARANVRYQGRSAPGGAIDAHLIFSNGVAGVLDVQAQLAVGGEYQGALVVK